MRVGEGEGRPRLTADAALTWPGTPAPHGYHAFKSLADQHLSALEPYASPLLVLPKLTVLDKFGKETTSRYTFPKCGCGYVEWNIVLCLRQLGHPISSLIFMEENIQLEWIVLWIRLALWFLRRGAANIVDLMTAACLLPLPACRC